MTRKVSPEWKRRNSLAEISVEPPRQAYRTEPAMLATCVPTVRVAGPLYAVKPIGDVEVPQAEDQAHLAARQVGVSS